MSQSGCGTVDAYKSTSKAAAPGGPLDVANAKEQSNQRDIAAHNAYLATLSDSLRKQYAANEALLQGAQSTLESTNAAATAALQSARLSAAQRADLVRQQSAVQYELTQLKLQKQAAAPRTDPNQEAAKKIRYEKMKARAAELQKRVDALAKAAASS